METITIRTSVWFASRRQVLTFLLCIIIGMYVRRQFEVAHPAGVVTPERERGEEWNVVPIPNGRTEAAYRFYELVDTHPSKEVREQLKGLILNGEIIPHYGSAYLEDVTYPAAELAYTETPQGLKIALLISANKILNNPGLTPEIKQLMIFHGWIHVKQQREKQYPRWLLLMDQEEVPLDEKGLRAVFESEADAYQEECKLAMRMGIPQELRFCNAYVTRGLKEMRAELFKNYALKKVFLPHLDVLMDIALERK